VRAERVGGTRVLWLGVATALALAAISLFLPFFPVYDPWAWLVWGRELLHGSFETASGPSWKPLPVLIDAPLSLLGGAAPKAWLLIARVGWLCAPLLAGLLAARLSGEESGRWRWVAAAVAAGSVALTWDSFTPPLRQFTGGLSEPLLVALILGAVWAVLEERPGWVLGLGTAAALLRPECWPFLVVWAWFAAREHPRLRAAAIAVAVLVPLAWFVPDIVGAGTPLEGGETARAGGIEVLDGLEVLGRALAAPLAAVWIGVALLLWQGAFVNHWFTNAPDRRRDRPLAILLAGAGAWIALVALMAIAGFAGLPRFLAPATSVISIIGAVGIARTGASHAPEKKSAGPLYRYAEQSTGAPTRGALPILTLATLLLAVTGFGWRVAQLPGDLEVIERQTASIEHLFDLVDETGAAQLLACQGHVRMTHVREQTALAWKLDEPIASVAIRHRPRYGVALSTKPLPGGDVIAHAGRWRATRFPCPTR
jgi:MFS family permease